MTPERWQRILDLFDQAVNRPEDERAAWLARRCAGDPALEREVVRMLDADRSAGDFLGDTARIGPPRGVPPPAAFGRYRVVERIGGGGFSEVFRGFDPVLRRAVAIKVCRWATPEVRRRFAREAEIVARLDHPNVTTVYDFGLDGDSAYLVQELLGGEDLAHRLERSPPPPLGARVDLLLQIARGLGYAHEQGVVHRDVKPSNLRIEDGGRVKIMDFGIAALLGDATRLTQSGTVVGTAAYMAPEQIRGATVGPRADLYSFGAVAYELSAGRPPYRAESLPALLYSLLHDEPEPLAAAAPECPPALAALVERCLARDPAERPEGFGEVIAGLEAVAAGDGASHGASGGKPLGIGRRGRGAAPAPGAARRRRWALAAAAAIVATAAIALWLTPGTREAPAPAPATGLLAIDARPWAEVAAIHDSTGAPHAVPADPITPLAVTLPPGTYAATLRDPASGVERRCTAEVAPGTTAGCRVAFARLDARDFVARLAPPP